MNHSQDNAYSSLDPKNKIRQVLSKDTLGNTYYFVFEFYDRILYISGCPTS